MKKVYYRSVENAAPVVYPEDFPGSVDSTIPPGKFSFWFESPIDFKLSGIVAVATFSPAATGIMSFSDPIRELEIKEVVSNNPVKIKSWIVEEGLYTFAEDFSGFCICGEEIFLDGDSIAKVSDWKKENLEGMQMPFVLSKFAKNVLIVNSIEHIQAKSNIKGGVKNEK